MTPSADAPFPTIRANRAGSDCVARSLICRDPAFANLDRVPPPAPRAGADGRADPKPAP